MWFRKCKPCEIKQTDSHEFPQYTVSSGLFYHEDAGLENRLTYTVYPHPYNGDIDFPSVATMLLDLLFSNLYVITEIDCVVVPNKNQKLEDYFPYRYYHSLEQPIGAELINASQLRVHSKGFPHTLFQAYHQSNQGGFHCVKLFGYDDIDTKDSSVWVKYNQEHDYLDISINPAIYAQDAVIAAIKHTIEQYGKTVAWNI